MSFCDAKGYGLVFTPIITGIAHNYTPFSAGMQKGKISTTLTRLVQREYFCYNCVATMIKEGHTIKPGKGKEPPKVKDFEKALVEV